MVWYVSSLQSSMQCSFYTFRCLFGINIDKVTEKSISDTTTTLHKQTNILGDMSTNKLLFFSPSSLPRLSCQQPVLPPLPGLACEALPIAPSSSPAPHPPAAGAAAHLSASLTPGPAGTPLPGTPPMPVCVCASVLTVRESSYMEENIRGPTW